ncbi:hypothetical protein FVER14953_21550 [Fusarium verticillioides]|nr:hypothetical protein FVER14953_21550 [Fusarium verticillioides]
MPKGVSANVKPLVASETRARTATRRTASPDTRFPGQGRTNSSPAIVAGPSTEQQPKKPLVPHSKSYITPAPKAEPTLGFSMADIIGQQKREQEAVKEAVAKRSLQEIQQEQAFQEWWDQESRRTQEEEARRKQKEGREKDKDNKATKRGGRRGRGGKATGTGEAATNSGQSGVNGSRGGGTTGSSKTNTRGSGGGQGGGGVGGGRGRGGKGRGNKSQAA